MSSWPSARPLRCDNSRRPSTRRWLTGGGLVIDVGAPALWAAWYRPSARLGVQYLEDGTTSATVQTITNPQSTIITASSNYLGAFVDLCPFGAALPSTSYVNVTLAACATSNIGDLDDLWADLGGLGRTQVQIGRKAALRAFVDLSVGYLARLTGGGLSATERMMIGSPGIGVPERGGMWTFAIAGGIVLP